MIFGSGSLVLDGNQILTLWSRPEVAITGRLGCGSKQLTWKF